MIAEIGRKKLIRHNILVLFVCAETITHYWTVIGMEKASTQIVRFLLTIGLLYWIYSGSNTARYLGIILFWVGGFGLVMVASKIYEADFWWGISIGLNGLVYLLYARALIWSHEIKAFLEMQRS